MKVKTRWDLKDQLHFFQVTINGKRLIVSRYLFYLEKRCEDQRRLSAHSNFAFCQKKINEMSVSSGFSFESHAVVAVISGLGTISNSFSVYYIHQVLQVQENIKLLTLCDAASTLVATSVQLLQTTFLLNFRGVKKHNKHRVGVWLSLLIQVWCGVLFFGQQVFGPVS